MSAILMSIKPKWVVKILNGEKTKEIRKHFPKNFRGWVYIYCTKSQPNLKDLRDVPYFQKFVVSRSKIPTKHTLNGKVVARFWCDNVTEYINGGQWHDDDTFGRYDDYIKDNILEQSCLTEEEMFAHCEDLAFSAINISQLEIFDEPKELSDYVHYVKPKRTKYDIEFEKKMGCKTFYISKALPLKRPPQSWCYIHGQVIGGNPL